MLWPIVGSNWNNSAVCGSRAANWNNRSLNLNSNNGARGASDTWVVKMSELTHGWACSPWYFTKIRKGKEAMASSSMGKS